mmetsp:Transcript_14393/g.34614  ORF Transcript_14393/g.34614 Transcript_14393/m.34614 type:complete len:226 (-) Transcript_14393:618-1295(-)
MGSSCGAKTGSCSVGDGVDTPSMRTRLATTSALRLLASSSRTRLRSSCSTFFSSRSSIILWMRRCLSSASCLRFSSAASCRSFCSLCRSSFCRSSASPAVPSCAASLTSIIIVLVPPESPPLRAARNALAPPASSPDVGRLTGPESRRKEVLAAGLRLGGANMEAGADGAPIGPRRSCCADDVCPDKKEAPAPLLFEPNAIAPGWLPLLPPTPDALNPLPMELLL